MSGDEPRRVSDVPDAVAAIVDAALDARVEHCSVPREGAVADTYVLGMDGEPSRAVCKLGGANVWTGEVVEPEVVRLVGERTDLPVPSVLASGSLVPDGVRWGLYEFVEGDVPSPEVEEYRALLECAGARLGELHDAFAFEEVGGLVRVDGRLRLAEPTPANVLAWPLPGWLAVPGAGDTRCRPVLTHGDYHPGNLLVEGDEIAAVIDWGNAHVTHAEYALARAEARFVDVPAYSSGMWSRDERDALRVAFRSGYRRHAPLPPAYGRRASRYRLLWALQSGVNLARVARTPRGRTQLGRQVRNWFGRRGFD